MQRLNLPIVDAAISVSFAGIPTEAANHLIPLFPHPGTRVDVYSMW